VGEGRGERGRRRRMEEERRRMEEERRGEKRIEEKQEVKGEGEKTWIGLTFYKISAKLFF
jgi:hypothetical protein